MDYTFTLSLKDIQTIYAGLGELLLKNSAETFAKLSMQKEAQDKAAQPHSGHLQSLRDVAST
jgi:hypothetical protein